MDTPETFTERARRALARAHLEAYRYRAGYIGTEHLLLGLIHDAEDAVAQMLEGLGLPTTGIGHHVETLVGPAQQARPFHLPYSSAAKSAVERGRRVAQGFGHIRVDAEHILYGLSLESKSGAAKAFRALDADPDHIALHLMRQWDQTT